MKGRLAYPFLLAVVAGWLVSRQPSPGFQRIPAGRHPAPAWSMTDLDGRVVTSNDLAGKIVVLNFWATWCPPCRRELPDLEAFHQTHRERDVVVLGASTDAGGTNVVLGFLRGRSITYRQLMATPEIQSTFAVSSIPSTWIIGRDGRVEARYLGALTTEELSRAVAPLLSEKH